MSPRSAAAQHTALSRRQRRFESGRGYVETGFDPFLPEMRDDPYPTYERLRRTDPVHYSEKIRSWVLTRHTDVLVFFSDPRFSADRRYAKKYRGASRPGEGGSFMTDPPQHTRIRGLVTKAFTPRVIGRMTDRIEEVTEALLDEMTGHEVADVVSGFAEPLPMTVITEILGVPTRDRERFHVWGRAFAGAQDHSYSASGQTAGLEMAAYLSEVAADRRDRPRDDLVTALVEVSEGTEGLTDGEVIEVLVALLFAGHETTVNLIGNGLLALFSHPDQLERVRDEDVERTCVEELLRYDSPAQIISRTAIEDIDLDGRRIETGDAVIALLGAANRDPEVFDDPDVLDVGRDPNPHVAFGHGPHFCIGAQLSRLEGRIAIPRIVRRLPGMRPLEQRPDWRPTAVLRGLETLPVQTSSR